MKRSTRRNKPRRIGVLVAVALLLGWPRSEARPQTGRSSYPVAVARAGTWSARTEAQGRVRASREEVISSPFAIRVRTVRVRLGEQARAGAVLAEIEAPEFVALREDYAQAERQASLAEDRVRDAERRLEVRFATRDTVLQAKSAWSEAKGRADRSWAALSEALLALGEPVRRSEVGAAAGAVFVRARVSGRVASVDAANGIELPKGAKLFRLEDLSLVYVDVAVPLSEVPAWQQGSATLTPATGRGVRLRLGSSTPSLDSSTGLATLRYECPNRLGLLDGQWVRVMLSGASRRAVWVPERAVVARGGRTYCLVERRGGYEAVAVQVGPLRNGEVPVVGGLAPGARVVTDGAYELLYRDLNQLLKPAD